MKDKLNAVNEFHKTFGIGEAPDKPVLLDEEEYVLRHNLMDEENSEYYFACQNKDIIEIADALGDQLYILCGTILKHGLQHKIDEVFNEIQRSNMSKLGSDGKPIFREDGKIEKGENYFKPNIKLILDE